MTKEQDQDRAAEDAALAQMDDAGLERYARQLVLRGHGATGQAALASAQMAIFGCGGLGANVALSLAQAGVGQLELFDPDVVELSNLPRQPFETQHIGHPKAEALAALLHARNQETKVSVNVSAFPDPASARLPSAKLWLDCTDTRTSRRAISAARTHDVTLVFGAVIGWDAQVCVFPPGSPGFIGLFAEEQGPRQTCAEHGVWAPLANISAQIMASEALRLAMGQPSPLTNKLMLIDARDWRQTLVAIPQ